MANVEEECHWIVFVAGNKTDRDDREVPTAIGEEFAKQQGMYFLESSAKEADNVERLFYEIAAELIEQARTKEVGIWLVSEVIVVINECALIAGASEWDGRHLEPRNQIKSSQPN